LIYFEPSIGWFWAFASDAKIGLSVTKGSATRTAPPAIRATPAAVAESFATASLSDIIPNLIACVGELRPTRNFTNSSYPLMCYRRQPQRG
jgi:hypothetical protein